MPNIHSVSVGDLIEGREYEATNVSLFCYNAAIWNPHRIHYDEPYTTTVEKHPGVVIDGPLQGDWLTQVALNWAGEQGELLSFEYSNRRASYLGERLSSGGTVTAVDPDAGLVHMDLFITNQQGDVTSPGKAVVKLL
jgi:hydroxyacyl-ACP dehydratase HTD2-like protein with hotdog domain